MTIRHAEWMPETDTGTPIPRIVLMGEFSAGKSTVINALLGRDAVPTAATATQLPAIWFAHGEVEREYAIGADWTVSPLDSPDLSGTDLRRHAVIRLDRPDPVLRGFEIIDTPGISDPTLEGGELAIPTALADLVIWCTPANQAWRQTEVASWRGVPAELRRRSLLLVTRADTLGGERNVEKVRGRLEREAGGEFDRILFMDARLAALAAAAPSGERTDEHWRRSGGAALAEWIGHVVSGLDTAAAHRPAFPEESEEDTDKEHNYVPIPPSLTVTSDGAEGESSATDGGPADRTTGPPSEDADRPRRGAEWKGPDDMQAMATFRAVRDRVHQVLNPSERAETIEVPSDSQTESKDIDMTNMSKVSSTDISALSSIGGFIGGCLVDSETGLMMAAEGGANFDLEAAAAGNTEVVKAKNAAKAALGLDDYIEDILITLGTQFHLIRPLANNPEVFLYVALDKKTANLGMARIQVKNVEKTVAL